MTLGSPQAEGLDTDRRVRHGTTSLTREVAATPDRVFAAFADFSLRQRWFRIPGDPAESRHTLDFRVGGEEASRGVFAPIGDPELIEYRSRFLDIVENTRIVFSYELLVNGRRRTMAQVTVELAPLDTDHTRLIYTEQFVLVGFEGAGDQDYAHQRGTLPLLLNGLEMVATGRTRPPNLV